MSDTAKPDPDALEHREDMDALVKGGRTNTLGFVIRLIGGIPFLFLGYRLYGADEMGRFASAVVVVELFALICALGEKRGLAQRLTQGAEEDGQRRVNLVFDGMLASLIFSAAFVALLVIWPFPYSPTERAAGGTFSLSLRSLLLRLPKFCSLHRHTDSISRRQSARGPL